MFLILSRLVGPSTQISATTHYCWLASASIRSRLRRNVSLS